MCVSRAVRLNTNSNKTTVHQNDTIVLERETSFYLCRCVDGFLDRYSSPTATNSRRMNDTLAKRDVAWRRGLSSSRGHRSLVYYWPRCSISAKYYVIKFRYLPSYKLWNLKIWGYQSVINTGRWLHVLFCNSKYKAQTKLCLLPQS